MSEYKLFIDKTTNAMSYNMYLTTSHGQTLVVVQTMHGQRKGIVDLTAFIYGQPRTALGHLRYRLSAML